MVVPAVGNLVEALGSVTSVCLPQVAALGRPLPAADHGGQQHVVPAAAVVAVVAPAPAAAGRLRHRTDLPGKAQMGEHPTVPVVLIQLVVLGQYPT